ncbi:MAG: RNA polymerase sigma factor [Parcubacteria group bacterium]|nr:RNA polymerase sigma factor [Parcubacteria group bacterium]
MTNTTTAVATKKDKLDIHNKDELIRKLQKYDPNNHQNNGQEFEDLWSEFYQIYKRRVYSIILRIIGNPDEAEEVTQIAIWQVVRKLNTFRWNSSFSTWLYRLSVNQALMALRTLKTKRNKEGSYQDDILGTSRKIDHDPRFGYQQYNLDTECLTLKQVIPKLSRGYLAVLSLHDIEGYEHEEVGAFLGVTAGTTKSQLHKARLKVQHMLNVKAKPKKYDIPNPT